MPKFVYHSQKADLNVEADTETGAVQQIVDFENLIERNNICGLCKGPAYWNIRTVEKNKKKSRYYEKKCSKCGASMPYHCNTEEVKKGGLYFSWKDKWEKWTAEPKDDNEVFDGDKNKQTKGK